MCNFAWWVNGFIILSIKAQCKRWYIFVIITVSEYWSECFGKSLLSSIRYNVSDGIFNYSYFRQWGVLCIPVHLEEFASTQENVWHLKEKIVTKKQDVGTPTPRCKKVVTFVPRFWFFASFTVIRWSIRFL